MPCSWPAGAGAWPPGLDALGPKALAAPVTLGLTLCLCVSVPLCFSLARSLPLSAYLPLPQGTVSVDEGGNGNIEKEVGVGAYFGERALTDDTSRYLATYAATSEDCECFTIDRETFQDVTSKVRLRRNPGTA